MRHDGAFVAVQRAYLVDIKANNSNWHEFCSLSADERPTGPITF
jgi:hypothetical protein